MARLRTSDSTPFRFSRRFNSGAQQRRVIHRYALKGEGKSAFPAIRKELTWGRSHWPARDLRGGQWEGRTADLPIFRGSPSKIDL